MQATTSLHLVSINVALPRIINWRGKDEPTAIFKQPLTGPVMVRRENIDGDRQGDLTVHGGPEQAVYAYSVEDYAYWRTVLDRELAWGTFGENLTIAGISDQWVQVGDRFRVGTAELRVTRPRVPCFKLANKVGRPDMIKLFQESGRTGFYFAVEQEGEIAPGDTLQLVKRAEQSMTIREISALARDPDDVEAMQRAIGLDGIGPHLRTLFERNIARKQ